MEELLAGLGSAARLFGELEEALREPAPAGLELDTAGAFRFLSETWGCSWPSRVRVLLPDWVRKARLGLKLTTRSQSTPSGTVAGTARFGLGDLVQLPVRRGRRRPGDRPGRASRAGPAQGAAGPVARPVGGAGPGAARAGLRLLGTAPAGTVTAGEVLLAALGLEDGTGADAPLIEVDADGWLGDLLTGPADQRLRPMPAPEGFAGHPAALSGARPVLAGVPGPSRAWAASWPTTWAWVRRSSCFR